MTWLYLGALVLSGSGLVSTVIDWWSGARGSFVPLLVFSLGFTLSVGGLGWIYYLEGGAGLAMSRGPIMAESAPPAASPGSAGEEEPIDPIGSPGDRGEASRPATRFEWLPESYRFVVGLVHDGLGVVANLLWIIGFVFGLRRRGRRGSSL